MLRLTASLLTLATTALGACPCIEHWSYEGGQYSFCANPGNGQRTAWCPKAVHDDGSYTSELPYTYCEGAELEECDQIKEENTPDCPCVEGGEWKYRGQSHSYCADPADSGFQWCATKVDSAGNYRADYAICTEAVKASCDALKESTPLPACPCLPGGQWTFDGKRQSYCQKPEDIGRSEWCPTSAAEVSSSSLATLAFSYCEGRVLEACQTLEGSKLPVTCPCVEGGQWKHRETQYSYCEEKDWCATKVNEDGEYYKGNFAKCKGKEKIACHKLHELQNESGKNEMYGQYTTANTGCPCWFDLSRSDCACCTGDGVQCGSPMQGYCTSKAEGRVAGCPGIPASHWTLSNTGHPCYFDTDRTDCGWCAAGGAQCGEGERQGHCWDPRDPAYCDSVPGDCKHIPSCDSQATCKFDVKFGKHREHRKCVCNPGWVGNGIECFDSDGNPSVESSGSSSGDVSLTLAVTSKFYVHPHDPAMFPQAEGEMELINNITAVFQSGASCAARDTCNGTFVNLVESP